MHNIIKVTGSLHTLANLTRELKGTMSEWLVNLALVKYLLYNSIVKSARCPGMEFEQMMVFGKYEMDSLNVIQCQVKLRGI